MEAYCGFGEPFLRVTLTNEHWRGLGHPPDYNLLKEAGAPDDTLSDESIGRSMTEALTRQA